MLPTPQAEELVRSVDHAEARAAQAGRAISDTAASLDAVVRRLSGADGWSGLAGEQARRRVEDMWRAASTLCGHCLFLADVLRVEGSWLARVLLAVGSDVEVEDADRVLTRRLSEAADALAGYTDAATVACLDLTASTDGDPRAVAELWHSLDPAERQRLARSYPELGSVAGLSSATRDALNRTRLARLLDAGSVPNRTALAGLAEHLEADPRRLLLSLHDGRAVVASADLDGADRVVTLVPGTGSSIESLDRTAARAEALCDSATRAATDAGGSTAVDAATDSCVAVSWQGYDAPPDIFSAASSADRATAYAGDLQTFAAGLDAVDGMDGDDSPHTVVGYSYGSATLGAAAADPRGLAADRMIHVGSPGATVDSIAQQWVDDGGLARAATDREVVGVASRWDPVPWWSISGVLGGLPGSEDFGGMAVDVTQPGDGPGSIRDVHSRYFDPNTVSLDEIGRLIATSRDR